MKKILMLIVFLTFSSANAACLLDEETTACSIAKIQQPQPMQRTYSPTSTIKEFADVSEVRLKPSQNNTPSKNLRDFGPQTADYSYNTSCQFGICNPSGVPQLFERRGQ